LKKPNTKCRVCGKEYFCCSDSKKINSWRTMACSIECYKEYIRRIEASRNTNRSNTTEQTEDIIVSKPKSRKKKSVDSEEYSENIIIEN